MFYHTVLEGVRGVRLGKWLLQMAVVAEDLDALGAQRSLIHNVVRFVDALSFIYSALLFGVLIARANSKRQRWGDRLAKSIVINA
ncbi:MAG: RDD family protein [Halobacteriota archaeon]